MVMEAVNEYRAEGLSKAAKLATDVATGKLSKADLEAGGKSFVQSMKKSIIKREWKKCQKLIFGKNPKKAERDVLNATIKKAIKGGSLPSCPGKIHLRQTKMIKSLKKRKGENHGNWFCRHQNKAENPLNIHAQWLHLQNLMGNSYFPWWCSESEFLQRKRIEEETLLWKD